MGKSITAIVVISFIGNWTVCQFILAFVDVDWNVHGVLINIYCTWILFWITRVWNKSFTHICMYYVELYYMDVYIYENRELNFLLPQLERI